MFLGIVPVRNITGKISSGMLHFFYEFDIIYFMIIDLRLYGKCYENRPCKYPLEKKSST